MKWFRWIFRAVWFVLLFAFALNNQHEVELKWLMGYAWQAPMVYVVLGVFLLGCAVGLTALLPSWWRHRQKWRRSEPLSNHVSIKKTNPMDKGDFIDSKPHHSLAKQ
jgi:lipopolysaccharide assembly protein A